MGRGEAGFVLRPGSVVASSLAARECVGARSDGVRAAGEIAAAAAADPAAISPPPTTPVIAPSIFSLFSRVKRLTTTSSLIRHDPGLFGAAREGFGVRGLLSVQVDRVVERETTPSDARLSAVRFGKATTSARMA